MNLICRIKMTTTYIFLCVKNKKCETYQLRVKYNIFFHFLTLFFFNNFDCVADAFSWWSMTPLIFPSWKLSGKYLLMFELAITSFCRSNLMDLSSLFRGRKRQTLRFSLLIYLFTIFGWESHICVLLKYGKPNVKRIFYM